MVCHCAERILATVGDARMPNVAKPSSEELDRLELILGGHVFFQTLRSSINFDLFTLLARNPGASLARLSELMGLARRPLRILLLGCTALGLIEKRGDGYHNRAAAQHFLNRDSPSNRVPDIEFQHHLVYR